MIQNVTGVVVLHESWCRLFGLVLLLFRAQKIDKGLRLQDSADGKKLALFACNELPSDSKWELHSEMAKSSWLRPGHLFEPVRTGPRPD